MLDKTIYVDRLRPGEITRATRWEVAPGGKGINVTRQLTKSAIESIATGFMGGEVGRTVEHLLDEERVRHDFIHIGESTREGITIVETKTGTCTSVFEPGHRVSTRETDLLRVKCRKLLQQSSWLVLAGSTPSPEPDLFYKEILEETDKSKCRVILDSYGEAFKQSVKAKPFMVKPNVREFEQTFGIKLSSRHAILKQLDWLHESGVSLSVITNTERPFCFGYLQKRWKVIPPSVQMVNPVGSGDAFVATTIYGFMQNWEIERTIMLASAAGAVNASRWAVVTVTLNEALDLASKVALEPL
jgi:tagatose 6-phosphate kinase